MQRYNLRRKEKYNNERALYDFIVAYMVISTLNLFIKIRFGQVAGWSIISKGILALFLIRVILLLIRTHKVEGLFLCEFFAAILYAFSFLIGEVQKDVLAASFFEVAIVFIPLGMAMYYVKDAEALFLRLYYWSWPCIALMTLIVINSPLGGINDYNMASGYSMLLPSLVMIERLRINKRWIDLAISFWAVTIVLLYGSRGPLLCIVVFLILSIVCSIDFNSKRNTIKASILVLFLIGLVVFHKRIMESVLKIFINHGFNSRNITLFLYDVMHDSGRKVMYEYYLEKVMQRPLLGWGVHGGWTYANSIYPHNLFIELLLSFGLLFGIFFSLVIVITVLRTLLCHDSVRKRVALLLISASAYLLFSDSFIQSYIFFLCAGICTKTIRENRRLRLH